ncbi:hypothetical protein [Novosphingobium umbonatum]|nr:hypothetical protein [Novosphingobium umbonatum]
MARRYPSARFMAGYNSRRIATLEKSREVCAQENPKPTKEDQEHA